MSFSQFVFLSVRNLGHFKGRPKRSTRKPVPRGGGWGGAAKEVLCGGRGRSMHPARVFFEKNKTICPFKTEGLS